MGREENKRLIFISCYHTHNEWGPPSMLACMCVVWYGLLFSLLLGLDGPTLSRGFRAGGKQRSDTWQHWQMNSLDQYNSWRNERERKGERERDKRSNNPPLIIIWQKLWAGLAFSFPCSIPEPFDSFISPSLPIFSLPSFSSSLLQKGTHIRYCTTQHTHYISVQIITDK